MHARAGTFLKSCAHRRILSLGLPILLGLTAFPVAAQYRTEPDEVLIEEDVEQPSDTPTFAPSGALTVGDTRGWSRVAALYAQPPDLGNCIPGALRNEAKASFLSAFNALRAIHGLRPVRYNAAADRAAGEAALMMAANEALSHDPPPSWKCWTAEGAAAAGSSNLLGGVSSPYLAYEDDNAILAEWLIEGDGDEIGHRRWLLDPYLDETALGRFITVLPGGVRVDSAVMKVFDFPGSSPDDSRSGGWGRSRSPATVPAFVAWPQGDYPAVFFSPRARLSFSVSEDPADMDASGAVDFSQATVSISDGAQMLPVRDKLWDNEGYGVANCLSWRVDGIVPGRTYAVTIAGVRGARQDRYAYSFRIMR